MAPRTLKIPVPFTIFYYVSCVFLIGFQCLLPFSWILDSRGAPLMEKYTTLLRISISGPPFCLPMDPANDMGSVYEKKHKTPVMFIFALRVVVCATDVSRFKVLRRALETDNQTWFQLPWAILDQVIVNLSINQAALTLVHVFLSNLQTGLLITRLTTRSVKTNSKQ
ncbi:hypothetical protein BKA66DRAFT_9599 [Pyrenochaeta sp. MPI-SDFR-AT-0127]|nr:hypothetical protein BKA66DRAFT_9599 [Pyrenochaeta sp. MPI-SDFR-AT-0127]